MAIKKFIKGRIRELLEGGGGFKGGKPIARKLVSGSSPAPPGSPPGYVGEIGSGKPTTLREGLRTRIQDKGEIVEGQLYSIATRDGEPYPRFLELGEGLSARPWLKPTFDKIVQNMDKVLSRKPDSSEWMAIKTDLKKKVKQGGGPEIGKVTLTL